MFLEDKVHSFLYSSGLKSVIADCPEIDTPKVQPTSAFEQGADDHDFQLWQIIKDRAIAKLARLHKTIRYGNFIGSKIKLHTDNKTPMELDLMGVCEDGLFILELKVERSAERNAFSELFAYSNYVSGVFGASGRQDIANVLVAKLDNKITRQAFLYDLLINERNIIVYVPIFSSEVLESLRLDLFLPSDDDFRQFTNDLLSHDSMACAVVSFDDLHGWFDSEEKDGALNEWTKENLSALSGYTAQLMEVEQLHGFCFIRKPWKEIPSFYRNSLFICALNPFLNVQSDHAETLLSQFDECRYDYFLETPKLAFYGRLIQLAQRAIKDCLTDNYHGEVETPYWGTIVTDMQEVVFTHNFAFRPTGMMREAYVSYLNDLYSADARGEGCGEDLSKLKINEVNNWLGAWTFMESCGFREGEAIGNVLGEENDEHNSECD